jgi:hypothetical protein
MPITAPEVIVEGLVISGLGNIVATASDCIPLILSNFPEEYQDDAIAYLTSDKFKVETLFGYAYDPAFIPVFNIALSTESEGTSGSKQMFLGDIVNRADHNPNTESFEKYGSLWSCSVSIIPRCEKQKQALILYTLIKYIMLKNRTYLEANGILATKFSGGDLSYDATKQPGFVFSRAFKMDCLVLNTYDKDITDDATIKTVLGQLTEQVRVLEDDEDLGFIGG